MLTLPSAAEGGTPEPEGSIPWSFTGGEHRFDYLALGESVSMQSATLTLQGLSDDSLSPRRIFPALWREARTAVLLGLSSGTLVALVVLAWRREPMSALVIGGAIAASILMACFFGVLIPTLVRLFKADPRIAAGPLVLATTDIVTLVSYLWLGSVVLGG